MDKNWTRGRDAHRGAHWRTRERGLLNVICLSEGRKSEKFHETGGRRDLSKQMEERMEGQSWHDSST